MDNEIIKNGTYSKDNLNDLVGTLDDLGQLIAYLRDLSRQLVPLVDSLVPLSDTLNDFLENLLVKLEKFFLNNSFFSLSLILGIGLVVGYLTTGIIKNILVINKDIQYEL